MSQPLIHHSDKLFKSKNKQIFIGSINHGNYNTGICLHNNGNCRSCGRNTYNNFLPHTNLHPHPPLPFEYTHHKPTYHTHTPTCGRTSAFSLLLVSHHSNSYTSNSLHCHHTRLRRGLGCLAPQSIRIRRILSLRVSSLLLIDVFCVCWWERNAFQSNRKKDFNFLQKQCVFNVNYFSHYEIT